jgi:hypothetical protein
MKTFTWKHALVLFITSAFVGGTAYYLRPITNNYPALTVNTPYISGSMINFFELDRPVFKGKLFQVKVIDVVKVQPKNPNPYLGEVVNYRINLVYAPISEKPLETQGMFLEPQNAAFKRFLMNPSITSDYGGLDAWNLLGIFRYSTFSENPVFDIFAYQYQLSFSNLGGTNLSNAGYNAQSFEENLKQLQFVFYVGTQKDIVYITIPEIYDFIDSDERFFEREDLKAMYNQGVLGSPSLKTYR